MTKGLEGVDLEDDGAGHAPASSPNPTSSYTLPTTYLSHSQLNLWRICGHRYKLKYIDDMERPPSSNLGHGRLIHHTVEKLNQFKLDNAGEMPPVELVDDTITDSLDEYTEDIEVWDPKVPDMHALEATARQLSKIYYNERLPNTRPKALELRVEASLRGVIPFVGYIDMVEQSEMDDAPLKEAQNLADIKPTDSITDLKNTGKKYGSHRVANSMQLTLYSIVTGVERVAYDLLVQTKKPKFVRQESFRTPNEKEHALDVVEDVAHAISAGIFPKADPESWACSEKWCPFYDSCRGRRRTTVTTKGLEE